MQPSLHASFPRGAIQVAVCPPRSNILCAHSVREASPEQTSKSRSGEPNPICGEVFVLRGGGEEEGEQTTPPSISFPRSPQSEKELAGSRVCLGFPALRILLRRAVDRWRRSREGRGWGSPSKSRRLGPGIGPSQAPCPKSRASPARAPAISSELDRSAKLLRFLFSLQLLDFHLNIHVFEFSERSFYILMVNSPYMGGIQRENKFLDISLFFMIYPGSYFTKCKF